MNRIAWKKLSVFVLPVFSVASLLLGLAACGGGGGSSSPPKTMVEAERDQIRIVPDDPPPGGTRQIQDVSTTIPSSCPVEAEVCVRDHAFEDGDEVRVSINGDVAFSGEIFNRWQCRVVPVRSGQNQVSFRALNEGSSSPNTGSLRITGRGDDAGEVQEWRHNANTGSDARLLVTIGPAGGNCSVPGPGNTSGSPNPGFFPSPVRVTSSPQAPGQDLPNVEVAGAGSTTALWVKNGGTGNLPIRAGTWYEPKDGNAQRMIVTESMTVAAGQSARVSAACMQEGKPAPPTGLRFFSAAKQISGQVQQCQARCLGGSSVQSVQRCIWGCERPLSSTPTQYAALAWGTSETAFDASFGRGSTAAAARQDALNRCGSHCRIVGSGAFTNQCVAVAESECGQGCRLPGHAAGSGGTRAEAIATAIASCNASFSGCRVSTDTRDQAFVLCVGTAR